MWFKDILFSFARIHKFFIIFWGELFEAWLGDFLSYKSVTQWNTYETPPVVKTRKKSLISKENNSITVALYIVSVFDG